MYIYRLSSSTFTLHGLLAEIQKWNSKASKTSQVWIPICVRHRKSSLRDGRHHWVFQSIYPMFVDSIGCMSESLGSSTGRSKLALGEAQKHEAPASQNQTDATTTQNETHCFSCNIIWQTRVKWVFHRIFFPQVAGKHSEVEGGARGSWNLSTPHRWGEARELQELQRCSHDTANLWSRTVVMKEPWRLIFVRTGRGVRVAWGSSKAVQYRFGASKWPRSLTNALFKLNMLRSSQWS